VPQRTCACPQCGARFVTAHPRKKWCSSECAAKGNRAAQSTKRYVRHEPRPCPGCGSTFTPPRSDSTYCSAPCRKQAEYVSAISRNAPRQCRYCRLEFTPSRSDKLFCSDTCLVRHRKNVPLARSCRTCNIDISDTAPRVRYCVLCQRERVREHRERNNTQRRVGPRPKTERACMACGDNFSSSSPRARACSNTCLEWTRKRPGVPRLLNRDCAGCARAFKARYASQLYCSTRCLWDTAKARRRAAVAGVGCEPVSRAAVLDRDRWVCQLCHRRIPKAHRHPHPLSASLDHIIPISRGGAHTPTNVQASHLRCNLSKNNRGGGEQLLLIG